MLLYILKHLRLNLSNSVRELMKVMDRATSGHMKVLIRVIKYVEMTKDYELILDLGQGTKWEMKAYTDLDFAGDADNRKSISGFVIYLNGCLLA